MILEFPLTPRMARRLERQKYKRAAIEHQLYEDLYYRGKSRITDLMPESEEA